MLRQIALKCPILLLSRGHFRETATFRGGPGVYFQAAFILGLRVIRSYVNWNTRSHFFTVSGLVIMSVADFMRNFHSPVLIKMIGRYRIGQRYLSPSNSRPPPLAYEQAPLGG